MVKFKRDDIYFLNKSPYTNSRNTNSRNISNNIIDRKINKDVWNDTNIQKIHRKLNIYDYIIISNNNFNEIINDMNDNLKILILEKNKVEDFEINNYEIDNDLSDEKRYLVKNNILIQFDKQLLSIEKYIYNDNLYCIFENKKNINYFSKNIIIATNSIKENTILNNRTEEEEEEEKEEFIKEQEINKKKEENKKEENLSSYKTIKYYVRNYSNNCYNSFNIETFIFSTTPNGKSINKYLTLDKGTKYIFEMTSDTCPFNIQSSFNIINFKSNSNKYLFKNVGSVLKGQTIEFYIPENFNKSIFYFGYMNTKKLKSFKINKRNMHLNMHLTYN